MRLSEGSTFLKLSARHHLIRNRYVKSDGLSRYFKWTLPSPVAALSALVRSKRNRKVTTELKQWNNVQVNGLGRDGQGCSASELHYEQKLSEFCLVYKLSALWVWTENEPLETFWFHFHDK